MQIRLYTGQDLDRMLQIWLEGSKQAHDFIEGSYWESNLQAMKEEYIPMSQSYVLEAEGSVQGFVSMVDDYLAALFVAPDQQGRGYGKLLLDYVKERQEKINLKVYQDNGSAVRFYEKNGFIVTAELADEQTSAKEFAMSWEARR
ncbi:N-acetyltransferase [Paenibacillus pinihumi]|uniref:N-acetyltransferase n=1 Tax=Paenibacillus pinihumi TaxID=669462 RepID=UPI00040B472A|nr:N-acetyltransferase [Paenibacillus pinihumi]